MLRCTAMFEMGVTNTSTGQSMVYYDALHDVGEEGEGEGKEQPMFVITLCKDQLW